MILYYFTSSSQTLQYKRLNYEFQKTEKNLKLATKAN